MKTIIKNCDIIFSLYSSIEPSTNGKYSVHQCFIKDENHYNYLKEKFSICLGLPLENTGYMNGYKIANEIAKDNQIVIGVRYEEGFDSKKEPDVPYFYDNHGHVYLILKLPHDDSNTSILSREEVATICEYGLHEGLFDLALNFHIEWDRYYEVSEQKLKEHFKKIDNNKYLFIYSEETIQSINEMN